MYASGNTKNFYRNINDDDDDGDGISIHMMTKTR
jgi:hypothetical protein